MNFSATYRIILLFSTFLFITLYFYFNNSSSSETEFLHSFYELEALYKSKVVKEVPLKEKYVSANNSENLPNRQFIQYSFEELCEKVPGICVPRWKSVYSPFTIVPKYKIGSCAPTKCGSTAINGALCYLQDEEFFESSNLDIMKWIRPHTCTKNSLNGYKSFQERFNLTDEWKLLNVKREPVDRFLSGFIERCIVKDNSCLGCGYNLTCYLEKAVEKALIYNNDISVLSHVESHTLPQAWSCELETLFNKFIFIEYSNDPTVSLLPNLRTFLQSQRVPESSIKKIEASFTANRTAHSTGGTKYREILEKRLRTSPYLLELLVRLLYPDFVTLGFSYPRI